MRVTLSIILYKLGRRYETYASEESNSFERVNLLPEKGSVLSDNMLYVGKASDYLKYDKMPDKICCLCVADQKVNKSEIKKHPNLVLIKDTSDLSELFNEVISIFYEMSNWTRALENSIAEDKGFQGLVDVSESILNNHVDIMDGTFKLLAYTKNVQTHDTITTSLIQNGSHPKDLVERFYDAKIIEEIENSSGLIIADNDEFTDEPVAIKVFNISSTSMIFVVMVCDNHYPEQGYLDLYRYFLDFVEVYAIKSITIRQEHGELYALFSDLLEQKITTKNELLDRATYINFPVDRQYICMTVKLEEEASILISRIIKNINGNIYSCTAVPFRKRIVIIFFCDGSDSLSQSIKRRIKSFLTPSKYYIGISNVFDDIWDLPTAYEQTMIAIDCGIKVHTHYFKNNPKETMPREFLFEDYFIEMLLFRCGVEHQAITNSFVYKSMRDLKIASGDKGVDLVNLLDTYFKNNCRATDTGVELHMHRNSVLYHIERIEKILGVSLEDSTTCVKLQLAILAEQTGIVDAM